MAKYPVKVLYVIDTLKVGGAQLHLAEVMEGIDPERFCPSVCSLGPATHLSRQLMRQGFSVRTLGLRNIYGLEAIRQLPRTASWIRDSKIDLVHTYLPSANVYGSIAARLAGVTNIVTSRRDMGFSRSWRMGFLEQTLVNPFVRQVVAVCDAVSSSASRDWFLSSDKIVTIYNGVDMETPVTRDRFEPLRLRDEMALPLEAPLITIVGSLTPVKAHWVFLTAAAKVLSTDQSVYFLVVGDGPLRAECEGLVEEFGIQQNVRFLGELPKQKVHEVLSVTEIGVLTSDSEGMSNALLDFMRHEKPIIATSVGGNPEVVENGVTGLLIPPRDPVALSSAMSQLIDDQERSREMGRKGRSRLHTHFSRRGMLRSVESLYELLLDHDRASSSRSGSEPFAERASE